MTAEEYLKIKQRNVTFSGEIGIAVSYGDALKAVEMAREEVKSSADQIIESIRSNANELSSVEFEKRAVLAAFSGLCENINYTNLDDTIIRKAISMGRRLSNKYFNE